MLEENIIKIANTIVNQERRMDNNVKNGKDVNKKELDDYTENIEILEKFIKKALTENLNLVSALEKMPVDEEVVQLINYTYEDVITFKKNDKGYSKVYFLPFLYKPNAVYSELLDWNSDRKEVFVDWLKNLILDFYGFAPEDEINLNVKTYEKALLNFFIPEGEEKIIPKLHKAILDNKEIKTVNSLVETEIDHSGMLYKLGVFPFVLSASDKEVLSHINFKDFEYEFFEGFIRIFDLNEQFNYRLPMSPVDIIYGKTKMVLEHQIKKIASDIMGGIKKDEVLIINTVFNWNPVQKEILEFISVNFEYYESGKNETKVISISKDANILDTPESLINFLIQLPVLKTPQVKIVIGNSFGLVEENLDDED